MVATGMALIATAHPAAVTGGLLLLVAVVVLGFAPVRRWRPALDALAAQTATALDRALPGP